MPRGQGVHIQRVKTGGSRGVIIHRLGGRKRSPLASDEGEPDYRPGIQRISNALLPLQRRLDEEHRLSQLRAYAERLARPARRVASRAASETFPSANEEYVKDFNERKLGYLQSPPSKKLIIVTCMDARIDPAASLGITEGDAHVIRNAGGSARDAIRSILVSQHQLGTREIAVFHHTGCGMLTFTSDQFQSQLKVKHPDQAKEIEAIDFLTFPELEPSVKADVEYLKQHPLLVDNANITGWVYEVETGKVRRVV